MFGFILGILLTPALGYGAGWGYARAGSAFDPIGQTITDRTRLYGALAVMVVIGLLMGIIIVARWASPLVALIPALVFLGWTGYFLLEPRQALQLSGDLPPAGDLDAGLRTLLSSGVLALMGFALFVPFWVPRRWRREQDEESRF